MKPSKLSCKFLGRVEYLKALKDMQAFTAARTPETPDEIWLLEHSPVFTLGRHADPSHLLNTDPTKIPVVKTDRGGQVTYHGPGQLIIYFLLDLKKLKIGPKKLVCKIEKAALNLLNTYGVLGELRSNAPGIYVNQKKIASLGLRVTQGFCYHGLSLNIQMDLSPFKQINPCGYQNLEMTQLSDYVQAPLDLETIGRAYCNLFTPDDTDGPLINCKLDTAAPLK